MWIDELGEFASAEAVDTAGTGTDLLGDVIDTGTTSRDLGVGTPVYLVIQCTETLDSAGDNATLVIELASDAQAAIATDGSATIHYTSPTLGVGDALATAGGRIAVALPQGVMYERYLGVLVTSAVEAPTAGAYSCFLTHNVPAHIVYPESPNV